MLDLEEGIGMLSRNVAYKLPT